MCVAMPSVGKALARRWLSVPDTLPCSLLPRSHPFPALTLSPLTPSLHHHCVFLLSPPSAIIAEASVTGRRTDNWLKTYLSFPTSNPPPHAASLPTGPPLQLHLPPLSSPPISIHPPSLLISQLHSTPSPCLTCPPLQFDLPPPLHDDRVSENREQAAACPLDEQAQREGDGRTDDELVLHLACDVRGWGGVVGWSAGKGCMHVMRGEWGKYNGMTTITTIVLLLTTWYMGLMDDIMDGKHRQHISLASIHHKHLSPSNIPIPSH